MEYLRIKKNTDFQKIFLKGSRVFASSLTVIYSPSPKMSMGVCVGKKHGNAVTRNKIKRVLREIFRKNVPILKKENSYLLIPKVAQEYNYHTLEKDFIYIIKKGKLEKKQEYDEKPASTLAKN